MRKIFYFKLTAQAFRINIKNKINIIERLRHRRSRNVRLYVVLLSFKCFALARFEAFSLFIPFTKK